MKKTAVCISMFMIIGILCLAGFGQAAEEQYPGFGILGSDKEFIDDTSDLYKSTGDGYESTSTQVDWLDLVNVTFMKADGNYTITATFKGNYDSNLTIDFYIEIHGDSIETISQPQMDADIWVFIHSGGSGTVQAKGVTYVENDIDTISGKKITWTFPEENITNIYDSYNEMSEWNVFIKSMDSETQTYYDFLPNYSISDLPNEIPGFPLLMIGLISIVSVLFVLRKVRKS